MGTRNLTIVISNDKVKVAQYGQWDGNPASNGIEILKFLRNCHLDMFRLRLEQMRWITDKEATEINNDPDWIEHHPYLSRDTGAQILKAIHEHHLSVYKDGKRIEVTCFVPFLENSIDFVADSLQNEWTYVIDLDQNVLEVYAGFNTKPLTKKDRFFSYMPEEPVEYYPVKLVKSYPLDQLPDNKLFIEETDPPEDV